MNNPIYKTREEWLEHAVELFTPLFKGAGYKVPRVRVACGWPSSRGTSKTKRTIGQCWANEASADGINQIFISPYLDDVAGEQGVLATLVHEVVHAVVGIKEAHNKVFKKCATAVGLVGKMTCTTAGEALVKQQVALHTLLGDYPHAKLDLTKSPVKKQTTRMHKCVCRHDADHEECGYTVRLSQKWLDEVGAPHCPEHGEMAIEQKPKGEGDENED